MSAHPKHNDQYDRNPEGNGGWRQIPVKARSYSYGKENSAVLPHAAGPRPEQQECMGRSNASRCMFGICLIFEAFI